MEIIEKQKQIDKNTSKTWETSKWSKVKKIISRKIHEFWKYLRDGEDREKNFGGFIKNIDDAILLQKDEYKKFLQLPKKIKNDLDGMEINGEYIVYPKWWSTEYQKDYDEWVKIMRFMDKSMIKKAANMGKINHDPDDEDVVDLISEPFFIKNGKISNSNLIINIDWISKNMEYIWDISIEDRWLLFKDTNDGEVYLLHAINNTNKNNIVELSQSKYHTPFLFENGRQVKSLNIWWKQKSAMYLWKRNDWYLFYCRKDRWYYLVDTHLQAKKWVYSLDFSTEESVLINNWEMVRSIDISWKYKNVKYIWNDECFDFDITDKNQNMSIFKSSSKLWIYIFQDREKNIYITNENLKSYIDPSIKIKSLKIHKIPSETNNKVDEKEHTIDPYWYYIVCETNDNKIFRLNMASLIWANDTINIKLQEKSSLTKKTKSSIKKLFWEK